MIYEPSGPVPRDEAAADILAEREGALMWPERFGPDEVRDLGGGRDKPWPSVGERS